jgi:hypothetical protein
LSLLDYAFSVAFSARIVRVTGWFFWIKGGVW